MLESIVMSLVHAVALPTAEAVGKGWIRLYTSIAPEDIREDYREDMLSDFHEHIAMLRTAGFGSTVIALLVLCRMARGLIGNLVWAAPYAPATLVARLEATSKVIGHREMPALAIAVIAFWGLVNFMFVASDDRTWGTALSLNGSVLLGALILWKKEHPWTHRMMTAMPRFFIVFGAGVLLWVVLQHRLYSFPLFYPMMMSTGPLVLAWRVASKPIRGTLLRNKWWLVIVAWSLIAGSSLAISNAWGTLEITLMVWGMAFFVVIGYALLAAMYGAFLFVTAAVWCGGVAVSIRSMNLLAAGIRRLL